MKESMIMEDGSEWHIQEHYLDTPTIELGSKKMSSPVMFYEMTGAQSQFIKFYTLRVIEVEPLHLKV
jgi:hypothetical protein